MDPETFEAGVGGRAPLRFHNQEIPDLAAGRPGEQAELQQELAETERNLTELQAAKGESDLLILSEEQQADIDRFMDRKLDRLILQRNQIVLEFRDTFADLDDRGNLRLQLFELLKN